MLTLYLVSTHQGYRTWIPWFLAPHSLSTLGKPCSVKTTLANQAAIAALANHTPSDLWALQQADPVRQELLLFWEWNQRSNLIWRRVAQLQQR